MATTIHSPRGSESITYSSGPHTNPPDLRIIHYNDVYHVEPGSAEPVGGIARFKTLCNQYQSEDNFPGQPSALTFFSGDAFSPSLESSVTKGKHMVDALNMLNTDCSCLGNHDLDFGVERFMDLAARCKFPWLCANVLDPALGENVPLGNCKRTVMLQSSNGIMVGAIGIVEKEWLDAINILPPNLQFLNASETVAELAPKLRAEGAEMVVVVAHQRQLNDDKLATELKPETIDMILGGHDHYYAHSEINGTHVLRSGSDFKQLSYLECRRKSNGTGFSGWDVDIVRRDVVGAVPEDPTAVAMVDSLTASLKAKLEKPIGYTLTPLDARFTTIRLEESNVGNFVCDLMRFYYSADCCIMGAGTLRADQIFPPGVLKVKDIMNLVPFEDPCVVIALKGKCILEALENGVSTYPAYEGRFPQVSGIEMIFNPKLDPGKRCSEVRIGGEPLDLDREYTIATRDFMVRGRDGYASLMLEGRGGTARSIVSDESGMLLSALLRSYFTSLKVLGRWKSWGSQMGQYWNKIHEGMDVVQPVRETKACSRETSPTQDTINPMEEQLQFQRNRRASLVNRAQHPMQRMAQPVTKHRGPACSVSSDSEDDVPNGSEEALEDPSHERRLVLMRKVMRKWWRLAGLKHNPNMVEQKGDDFGVLWTKGISPKVEGRIVIVGS